MIFKYWLLNSYLNTYLVFKYFTTLNICISITTSHGMHAVQKMRPIATDVPRIVVCLSVCQSHGCLLQNG